MTQSEKDRMECLRLAVLLKTSKCTSEEPTEIADRFYRWITKDPDALPETVEQADLVRLKARYR